MNANRSFSKKSKFFLASVVFFLSVVLAGYITLQNLSALKIMRWVAEETKLPVQIHNATWDASFKLIWSSFWNRLFSKDDFKIELSNLYFSFSTDFLKNAEVHTSFKLNKKKDHWSFELQPHFKSKELPEFSGTLRVQLDLVQKITQGLDVDFHFKGLKPLHYHQLSIQNWNTRGTLHYEVGKDEKEPPLQGKVSFLFKDIQYLKDKVLVMEPEFELKSTFDFFTKKNGFSFENVTISSKKPFLIEGTGDLDSSGKLDFKVSLASSLKELLDVRLADWLGAAVEPLRRAKSEGQFKAFVHLTSQTFSTLKAEGNIDLHAKKLELPLKKISLTNLNLNLPLSYPENPSRYLWGKLKFENMKFASIDFNKISIGVLLDEEGIDATTEVTSGKDIPIIQNLWGGKIELSHLYTHLDFAGEHEFTAQLKGGPFQLQAIQKDFCIAPDNPLEGSMILFYPKIVQNSSGLMLTGDTSMDVFGGNAYMGDVAVVFDKDYPRINLNLFWNDLDLARIGVWTNFGDMRGSIDGSLSSAKIKLTPVGPVPMEYNLKVSGNQRGGKKIRFYGRAVNNILELLGNQRENIPWIGRVMLDTSILFRNLMPAAVDYMGFRAQTNGDWTELTTLDPDEILENTKKHYFLYGSAFTIPLNSHDVYPVFIRTSAFQGRLYSILQYFKEKMKNDKNKTSTDECVPIW